MQKEYIGILAVALIGIGMFTGFTGHELITAFGAGMMFCVIM